MKHFLFLLTTTATLFAHNPLEETADYLVDRDPKRTSSMVKSGSVHASVPKYIESTENGPSYQVVLDYQFKISFVGNYQGTEETVIEKEFFSEEFLEKLRKNGSYKGKYFNAKHLGYADARNMDGRFYPHCDKILLTDLKKPKSFSIFEDLLSVMASGDRKNIEDMKVLAHIHAGVPVIGAVKLDVSGLYKGMSVKAGADYSGVMR